MIKVYSPINLNNLKELLKKEVKNIPLTDLYKLSEHFNKETEYLPEAYKEEYIKTVQNIIISRLNALKNDNENYDKELKEEDIVIINKLLSENDIVTYLMNISSIYAIYFLKEPIHNINTVFPGRKNVYKKGKDYYCPVKKYHITNKKSLCRYCIAKTIED